MQTSAQRLAGAHWMMRVAAIALGAALLSLFRFSPNFPRWSALGTPFLLPEVARADDVLRQLEHPLVHIDSYTNRVLQWRLFFPLLGHALHLPPKIYLALPHVGCLAVLAFVVGLVRKHGFGWSETFAAAALSATCSWFFVSAGLLGFFDSWYVLGLLLLVFSEDARWAVAAVLITPWIDERFVIMLPLSLALRTSYLSAFGQPRDRGAIVRELVWLGVALLPWLIVRLGTLVAGRDPVTRAFFQDMPVHQGSVPAKYYFLGMWHGIRWAWIFVVWLIFAWRKNPWRIWLLLGFLLTFAVNLVIAEDISRSVSTLVPAIVLGLLLFWKQFPLHLRPALWAACALNFVFPAAHVVGDSVTPIRYFYAALEQEPLTDQQAAFYYNQYAFKLLQYGRVKEALPFLDKSLELDPTRAEPYINRAAIEAKFGNVRAALTDADRAATLNPKLPGAWSARGTLRAAEGDFAGALSDFHQALLCAPPDWSQRTAVLSAIKDTQAKRKAAAPATH